jgi:hypothetical protein
VTDLRPLEGMPLEALWMTAATEIADFSLLRTFPLRELSLAACPRFGDLKLLGVQPQLELLWIGGTSVTDLTPLRALPKLKTLSCDDQLARQHLGLLRELKLETINNKPAAEFFKTAEGAPPAKP